MGEARASHLPLTGLRVHNLHHSTTPPRILPHQLTREASPIGPLQDQHHEACRGSSDSKSLLLTPRPQDPASAPGGGTQIDPGSAFAERSLYRSYLLWNFFCAFVPQVLRGSRKCWHLGAFNSSAQLRLLRYEAASGHTSSARSCGSLWASSLKVVKGHHHHQVVLFLASSS